MEQIKQTTLKKANALLNAVGAQYAIIDADGEKHGTLEVTEKRKSRKRLYKHGELTAYCVSNFKELSIGDVFVFPIGSYPIQDMQRTLSSWLCKQYGNSTHTTCMSEDRQSIEVLRVA